MTYKVEHFGLTLANNYGCTGIIGGLVYSDVCRQIINSKGRIESSYLRITDQTGRVCQPSEFDINSPKVVVTILEKMD